MFCYEGGCKSKLVGMLGLIKLPYKLIITSKIPRQNRVSLSPVLGYMGYSVKSETFYHRHPKPSARESQLKYSQDLYGNPDERLDRR